MENPAETSLDTPRAVGRRIAADAKAEYQPRPLAPADSDASEVRKMLNNARRTQPPFAKVPLLGVSLPATDRSLQDDLAGKKTLMRQGQPRDSGAVRSVFQTIVGKDPRSVHAAKLYAADAT